MLQSAGVIFVFVVLVNNAQAFNITAAQEYNPGDRFSYSDLTAANTNPYAASLIDPAVPKYWGRGAILNSNWAIFTASEGLKVKGKKDSIFIYTGFTDLNSIGSSTQHIFRWIKFHPDFVVGDKTNDIALFNLCSPVTLPTYATLPPDNFDYLSSASFFQIMVSHQGDLFGYELGFSLDPAVCGVTASCPLYDASKHYLILTDDGTGQLPTLAQINDLAPVSFTFDSSFSSFILLGFVVDTVRVFDGVSGAYVNIFTSIKLSAHKPWILESIAR